MCELGFWRASLLPLSLLISLLASPTLADLEEMSFGEEGWPCSGSGRARSEVGELHSRGRVRVAGYNKDEEEEGVA